MDEHKLTTAGSTSLSTSPGSTQPVQPNASLPAAPSPAADPDVIARRERSIVDGILSNESLTADLDDEAAQEIIDWSLAMAREAVYQTAGMDEAQAEKTISERMYTQRKLVRAVKRLVLEDDSLDERSRADLLDQIGVQTKMIYGDQAAPIGEDPSVLLKTVREPDKHPGKAIKRMRSVLVQRSGRLDDAAGQIETVDE